MYVDEEEFAGGLDGSFVEGAERGVGAAPFALFDQEAWGLWVLG